VCVRLPCGVLFVFLLVAVVVGCILGEPDSGLADES
jgi:hypothetical protein